MSIFPVQLTTCRIGNLTRLIHTLAICVTINIYILHSLVEPKGRNDYDIMKSGTFWFYKSMEFFTVPSIRCVFVFHTTCYFCDKSIKWMSKAYLLFCDKSSG